MFCSRCGKQISEGSAFCPGCGNPVGPVQPNYNQPNNGYSPNNQVNTGYQQNNGYVPNYNQVNNGYNQSNQFNNQNNYQPNYNQQPNYNSQPKKSKSAVGLIIAIFVGIFVIAMIAAIVLPSIVNLGGGSKKNRTVMIYMTGSDLETKGKYASSDLENILKAHVNLDEVNVLVIAGGSKTWHKNYISQNETSIYKLTETGFVKEKVNSVKNMGDASLLADFLNYSYNNYKAEKYDLILWNHGTGMLGTNSDELSNDTLYPAELRQAMERSPFNANNKLEYVNLITCLEGNYEYALMMSNYANYYIGSEEVSLASDYIQKLNYLTKVSTTDNALRINQNLIDNYFKSLKQIDNYYESFRGLASDAEINAAKRTLTTQTYSIIDLSKMKKVESALESFINDINLNNHYRTIAKVRSRMVAYGTDQSDGIATVDLYTLIEGLKTISPTKAEQVLSALRESIVYNRANNSYSKGLSIYFPYNDYQGNKNITLSMLELRNQVYSNSNYQKFIVQFYNMKSGNSYRSMAFEADSSANISSIKANTEFGIYLTNEDLEDYTKANYHIFKKVSDGYLPVYKSSDVLLNEETGYLKINYNNKGLKINNEIKSIYLNEIYRDEKLVTYVIPVKLYTNDTENVDAKVTYSIDLKTGKGFIELVTLNSSSDADKLIPNMAVVDLKDYKYIEFATNTYNITNDSKKYNEAWELVSSSSMKFEIENFKIDLVDLSDDDNYVAVVEVIDVYGNGHYTNIIPIEN